MENDLKNGKRFLTRANATRDQYRMLIREKLDVFKAIVNATDEQLASFAESDPSIFRFMATAIIHEASLEAVQNSLENLESVSDGRDQ